MFLKRLFPKRLAIAFLSPDLSGLWYDAQVYKSTMIGQLRRNRFLSSRVRNANILTINPIRRSEILNNFGQIPAGIDYKNNFLGFAENNHGLIEKVTHTIGTRPFFNYSKKRVIDHLQYNVKSLVGGEFVGSSASNLLHGQKGIGKSSGLVTGAIAAGLLHTDLISVYIEYSGVVNELKTPSTVLGETLGLTNNPSIMTYVL
mmetsp:Transcript_25245/g.42073  ORF Transcript_25245/g.42073 Transcript_25245/m.42073 type:complete len:202 (-) Transcript_25245:21-626(-)